MSGQLLKLTFPFMDKRMLEYWSSMYNAEINSGDLYSVLKPSISILITDYRVPKLEHLSGDPNFKRLLESRAGFLRDVDAKIYVSKEEGKQEGKQEEKQEIAKKLLELGDEIEKIIAVTGLTKEEIEKLKNNK